jgi:DNA-binding MarR family transcriptional regulator
MSTIPNSPVRPTLETAPEAERGAITSAGDTPAPISDGEALAVEVAAFVAAFDRWSGRKAAEVGASAPRMKLLYAIRCHGPRKMADLAEALDTTPRNVTAIVDALEADGLVRRTPHATDRRVTLVELTCDRDRVAEQFGRYLSSVEELFANLDQADRRTLLRLLGGLRSQMRDELVPGGGDVAGRGGQTND